MLGMKPAQKLAGLSSEQMSIFSLKKSVECAAGFWSEMLISNAPFASSSVLQEKCVLATETFHSVIQSTKQLKDSTGALQTFLSEDVMIAYLRLALLTCGNHILNGIIEDSRMDQISVDILWVVAACLKCMDSGDNIDKLTNDFTEGAIYIINISIVALRILSASRAKLNSDKFLVNLIQLTSIYVKALSTMSRKFSNRKKLYVTFCSRLLGPCIKIFQSLEHANLHHNIPTSQSSSFNDLMHVLETLIENSLFFEEKNTEDLAISESSIENFKARSAASDVNTVGKETTTFKGSYHGGYFDAITATCSEVFDEKNIKSHEGIECSGYPYGVARLLHIYGRCSYKILSSSLVVDQNYESRNMEVGKSPSSLQERRKHTIRLLQTALSLLAVVDGAYERQFVSLLSKEQHEGSNEDMGSVLLGYTCCLVACIQTQRELLLSLSLLMDETGGSSILATHDNLQSIAKRLHSLSSRSLKGASVPLSVFLSPDLMEKYSTLFSSTSDIHQRAISNLNLEARSIELDCVRILVDIDHRVIIETPSKKSPSKQADARLPSLVLQAIAYSAETKHAAAGDMAINHTSAQLNDSKEQLLLSVINLYDDLRRMDDFVSEVRGVCRGEPTAMSSLFTLLSSQTVQDRLSRAFASLPVSQSELVWSALTRHTTATAAAAATAEKSSSTSSKKRSDKRCESMILRALVQASALTSMIASSRHQGDTSCLDDTSQSCDNILQLGAVISLPTALPDAIVQSMSALFLDTVATLVELEKESEMDILQIHGRRREHSGFVYNMTSMLLQYGSVAISLHKSTSAVKGGIGSSKEDVWLPFRQCAGAISGLKVIQRPGWQRYCDAQECVAAAAALFSLSAFVATCSSLQLALPIIAHDVLIANCGTNGKMDIDGEKDSGEATALPSLTCDEVDSFVLEMITTSSAAIDHHANSNALGLGAAPLASESGSKRKRKDIEVADTRQHPPSSVAAIDLLLIITRTVSVWQHLNPAPEMICALTIRHLNDVTRHDSDPNNSEGRGLFQKHACLCRLIQLVAVLECPVLVTGFLMAVEHVIVECSASLSSQTLAPNSKTRSKTVKATQPLSIAAMSLLSQRIHKTLLSHRTGLPVGDLLTAAAASLVVSKRHYNPNITADIALRALTVITKLLSDLNRSTSNDILSWEDAASSLGTDSNAEDKQTAFAAAVSVLQHCLRSRPASTMTSTIAPDPIATKSSKPDSWYIVELQLQSSFVPLLTALTTENSPVRGSGVCSLILLVLDYLLSGSTDLTSNGDDTGNKFGVNTVVGAVIKSITTVLKAAHHSSSTLRSFVEIFRHVSSFYCSLPAESDLITETCVAVKASIMTLLSVLQPHLQRDVSAAHGVDNYFDPCCFLAADSVRLHAKCSEVEEVVEGENVSDLMIVNIPCLHGFQTAEQSPVDLDGWFLLTGNIMMLQRRSGKLLSVRTSTLLIERISQALLLAAATYSRCVSSTSVTEESLVCVSVCLKGLITSTPPIISSELGKMFMQLAQHCAVSSDGVSDITAFRSSTALSRYVVIGVDNLLSSGGQNGADADADGNGTLASARAVLESVALSCTSDSQMLTEPELVLSLISALRRGITTIQQQQQRSHRRASKSSGKKHEELVEVIQAPIKQDEDSFKGKDHTLTRWASCCISVLSKIAPRLVRGGGGIKGTNVVNLSDKARVDISAHALSVLEQLFACDSVGGSNLPLLGYSIGTLGALLSCTIRVILASSEQFSNETRKMSTSEALSITNALRVAGRTLTAASSSRELTRHAHILAASLTDLIAQRPLSTNAKELLLPGLFALFDRCKQKQRLQMFATVNVQTRAVLSDLHGTYLRDYKFTGK